MEILVFKNKGKRNQRENQDNQHSGFKILDRECLGRTTVTKTSTSVDPFSYDCQRTEHSEARKFKELVLSSERKPKLAKRINLCLSKSVEKVGSRLPSLSPAKAFNTLPAAFAFSNTILKCTLARKTNSTYVPQNRGDSDVVEDIQKCEQSSLAVDVSKLDKVVLKSVGSLSISAADVRFTTQRMQFIEDSSLRNEETTPYDSRMLVVPQKPRLFVQLSRHKKPMRYSTLPENDSNLMCNIEAELDLPESIQNDLNLSALVTIDRKVTLNSQFQLEEKITVKEYSRNEQKVNLRQTPSSNSLSCTPDNANVMVKQLSGKNGHYKIDTVLDLAQLLQQSKPFVHYVATKREGYNLMSFKTQVATR